MNTRTETLIGTFTSLVWIFVGVYLIWTGRSVGWQVAGGVAATLGIMRGIAVIQRRRFTRELPASRGTD